MNLRILFAHRVLWVVSRAYRPSLATVTANNVVPSVRSSAELARNIERRDVDSSPSLDGNI